MDRGTVYDSELYKKAFEIAEKNGIGCQTKTVVAGGNNASAIHKAAGGIKNSCRICSVQIYSLGQLGCEKRGYREHI